MSNKKHLSTWLPREMKERFAEFARLQGKSESAPLKSMVEAMLATAASPTEPMLVLESSPSSRRSVRLRDDDSLMLRDRAQARGKPRLGGTTVLSEEGGASQVMAPEHETQLRGA